MRALAVLPILLFHAGVPGFGGGYVGVDIFFVISGFLITSILVRDIEGGSFTVADFYERRVRRIFPALLAVLAATLVAGIFLIMPSEAPDFGASVLGSLLFVSNIVFWSQSGYFGDAAAQKPLLHTWSLGVEEQFYIFFPLFLLFVDRRSNRHRIAIVLVVVLASLGLCIVLTPDHQPAAFYLIPARAWELLTGALIAIGAVPRVDCKAVREALAAGGIALILAAVFSFTEETNFPGAAAILPVAGSALIIAFCQGTATARLLSQPALVWTGRISYSLYLWHWPLIVFARRLGLLDGSLAGAAGAVAASLLIAYLSFVAVETPFRNRRRFALPRIAAFVGTGSLLLILGGSVFAFSRDGLPQRFSPEMLVFDAGRTDKSPRRETCHIFGGLVDPAARCALGGPDPGIAVWGDSHGVEMSYALASPAHGVRQLTYSHCPPALNVMSKDSPLCARHNARVLRYLLKTSQIETVVLAPYFAENIDEPSFHAGMRASVRALIRGGKRVFVLGPVPIEMGEDLPRYLIRTGKTTVSRNDADARSARERRFVAALGREGADIIWPADALCNREVCHLTSPDGKPLLFDSNHLSLTGAKVLARKVLIQIHDRGP